MISVRTVVPLIVRPKNRSIIHQPPSARRSAFGPSPQPLPLAGEGVGRGGFLLPSPRFSGEREGPVAQRREGEGPGASAVPHRPCRAVPARPCAAPPRSRRGRDGRAETGRRPSGSAG